MAITEQITTAQQLFQATGLGRCELVLGELVMMSPAGFDHSRIALALGAALRNFVKPRGLGVVAGADGGFQIHDNPDTVRVPDVAYVRAERVPAAPPRGFFQGPPDLAVEVISPTDRFSEVTAKVEEWLAAGCREVWVVDPQARTVSVCLTGTEITILAEGDLLTGGDLLPGFELPVAEVFAA